MGYDLRVNIAKVDNKTRSSDGVIVDVIAESTKEDGAIQGSQDLGRETWASGMVAISDLVSGVNSSGRKQMNDYLKVLMVIQ